MAYNNKTYDIGALAEVDQNGFTAAMFPQIRDAYAQAMRNIYGTDIDLSSASADGQFINMEALVLNNIYRTLENIHNNMIPASAKGNYLDILASFSGVFRRQPTYSRAQVWIANNSAADVKPDIIVAMDKNGNNWTWVNPLDLQSNPTVTFPAKTNDDYQPVLITMVCNNIGAVKANGANSSIDMTNQTEVNAMFGEAADSRGGDIYQTVDSSNLLVFQNSDADVGDEEETDSSLRERMGREIGSNSTTVLNSVSAALLNIEAIEDVFVFSNGTGSERTMDDGATVPNHNVYVAIWEKGTVPDYDIANTLYNQLTPGVLTNFTGSIVGGTQKTYNILISPDLSEYSVNLYWKLCSPSNAKVQVTLSSLVSDLSADQQNLMINAFVDYLNNLKLGERLISANLLSAIMNVDLGQPNGGLSYLPRNVSILTALNTYTNISSATLPLTRFNFTTNDVSLEIDDNTNPITITISAGADDESGVWEGDHAT